MAHARSCKIFPEQGKKYVQMLPYNGNDLPMHRKTLPIVKWLQ